MLLVSDLTKLIATIEEINEDDVEGFMAYLEEIYRRFRIAKNDLLQKPFMLKQGLKLKTFDTADQFLSKYIKGDRLKNMISIQTLYIGISPYNGPSLYSMILMVDINQYYCMGIGDLFIILFHTFVLKY